MKKFLPFILVLLVAGTVHARSLVFPHLVVNSTWSFGIAITNAGDSDDIVRLEVWDQAGLIDTQQITVRAHDRWLMDGYHTGVGVYTIIVRFCSDWTFGTLIRFWEGVPVSEEPAQIVPYTSDLQTYNRHNCVNWVVINPANYYTKAGKCPYLGKYHWIRLKEVLREMYLRYQYHKGIDPRPSLGDANDIT